MIQFTRNVNSTLIFFFLFKEDQILYRDKLNRLGKLFVKKIPEREKDDFRNIA